MRVGVRAYQPDHRPNARVESGHAIGNLCLRNGHLRKEIPVKSATVNVPHDADDLPCGFVKLRPHSLADDDLLAEGIFLRPLFLCHAFVDQYDAWCAGYITVGEVASPQNRYFENFVVAG